MPAASGRRAQRTSYAPRHRETARLGVRVRTDLAEQLAAMAEQECVSVAVLVEALLDQALGIHEPAQGVLPLGRAS